MDRLDEYFEPLIEPDEPEPEAGPATEDDPTGETEAKAEAEGAAEDAGSRVAELKGELAAARADFYNYRQRMTRERQETRRRAEEDVITAFLPVLDNLDRALAVPEEGSARDVLTGVRMVQRQFLSALENLGVSPIPTEGRFDPSLHEAVATVPVEPEQDGVIVDEQLRGYRTQEKVLRPARVTVGRSEQQQ